MFSKTGKIFFLMVMLMSLDGIVYADREIWVWNKINDTEELKKLMVEHSDLIDPFSVQFRNTYQRDIENLGNTSWCGELNSKNRMGAYIGWNRFYVIWSPKKVSFSLHVEGSGMYSNNNQLFQIMYAGFCKDIP